MNHVNYDVTRVKVLRNEFCTLELEVLLDDAIANGPESMNKKIFCKNLDSLFVFVLPKLSYLKYIRIVF